MTVTGKTIKGKNGKLLVLKVGENCSVSDDGLTVIGEKYGIPELVGDVISVTNLLL